MNERCFAMRRRNGCGALNGNCPGYAACGFYKPRWKQEREQNRINARLSRLPMEMQYAIAEKYFEGRMPWKGETE